MKEFWVVGREWTTGERYEEAELNPDAARDAYFRLHEQLQRTKDISPESLTHMKLARVWLQIYRASDTPILVAHGDSRTSGLIDHVS
jgi:hypothetical protein